MLHDPVFSEPENCGNLENLGSCRFLYMEVSKIRGTILGVPTIRIIVYWGLYWGPIILGNYHITNVEARVLPVHSNHRDAGDMERFNASTRCEKDSSREFGTLAKAPTSKEKRERFLASTRTNRSEFLRTLPRFWRSRNSISHHAESQQAFCDRYVIRSKSAEIPACGQGISS